jgi:myo-inositol 2-dehydrogenase/D-chiro-inositol 1-dehydrogenase
MTARANDEPIRLAAVGVGRIGKFHARHVQEVAAANETCLLTAVVDRHADTAKLVAAELSAGQAHEILAFDSPEALAAAGVAEAAVVASRTADHRRDTQALVESGLRVLLEKPLADTLREAKELGAWLEAEPGRNQSVMLAFQRRYDEPLLRAKALLDAGRIGTLFKIVSILEDPEPPPPGYQSSGLLTDMGVHNADEVLWLSGRSPTAVLGMGGGLYNQKIDGVVVEDFDDAFVQLWLGEDVVAQIQVSRNHVAGYRNETTLYGTEGLIHVGHFDDDPLKVWLEAYGKEHVVIEKQAFPTRNYERPVPVFIRRFGPAYKAEVAAFVACCAAAKPFAVTHQDGLRAMAVVAAAAAALRTVGQAQPL